MTAPPHIWYNTRDPERACQQFSWGPVREHEHVHINMRRAQGFQQIRQFAHKPKVRRNAANIIHHLQSNQKLELTAWGQITSRKTGRVDTDRVNWRGYIEYSAMVFDPRPRLRRAQ